MDLLSGVVGVFSCSFSKISVNGFGDGDGEGAGVVGVLLSDPLFLVSIG